MILRIARISFVVAALIGFAGSAQAALISESVFLGDCDAMGCAGSTLFLGVDEQTDGSWLVEYTIDTTNYYGDEIGFNQIGFKAIKDWTLGDPGTYVDSFSTPLGAPAAYNDWNPIYDDPIASGSLCDTSNGDTDKVCITGFQDITTVRGEYTWTFRIADGTLMDTSEWHLGAQYANSAMRHRGHIISANVPEPTAALLFGLGAIVVTRTVRRR